jgi:hypothetical protein
MDADCRRLDRRATVRYAAGRTTEWRLRILPGHSAALHDVSSHGLAIRASNRLAPGRSIELRIDHGSERVALRAAVVWSRIDRLAIDRVEYLAGLQLCNGLRVPLPVLSGNDYPSAKGAHTELNAKPAATPPWLVAPALVTSQGTTPTGAAT